jgi:hypothetical protein
MLLLFTPGCHFFKPQRWKGEAGKELIGLLRCNDKRYEIVNGNLKMVEII